MKKLLSFLILSTGILVFPLYVSAKAEQNYENMLPTVRIVSVDYTKNGGIDTVSAGSATIISPDGLIITNNHVVEKEEDEAYDYFYLCISFDPQEKPLCEYTAALIERNRDMDIAILKMDTKDIRENSIPELKYLTYNHEVTLTEGDEIEIHGYPGIGGDTVTYTKGQVSGFEERNELTYVKTDTVISFGNSGGTALDAEGNYVGIPTFLTHDLNALGYFLDISEAASWIDEQREKQPKYNEKARTKLAEKLVLINDAQDTGKYIHPYTPEFSLQIPENWEYAQVERTGIRVASKNDVNNYEVSITIHELPFEITDEYLEEKMFKKFEKQKDQLKNYERKIIDFQDVSAHQISYLYWDTKSVQILIPYGGTLVFIYYEYDISEEKEAEEVYEALFENFSFLAPPEVPERVEILERETPPFRIGNTDGWYLQENHDPNNEDLLVEYGRPDNVEGEIFVIHDEMNESDKLLSQEDFLKNILDHHEYSSDFRLVSKNDNIVIDGLHGVALTYTYEGEDLGQTRKTSIIYLFRGEEYYYFRYDDLSKNYDTYIGDFIAILKTFQNLDEETGVENGEFDIGSLNYVFYDISYHRYEQSISRLKDKGIINGYPDNTFRPEKSVNRVEALKFILEAKMYSDEKRGDTELLDMIDSYTESEYEEYDFSDTGDIWWARKYIRYAHENEIVEGYSDELFHPLEKVTVAEACKMVFGVFEIPVWDVNEVSYSHLIPWYKPYMDKGFEMRIIPNGIYSADHELSRAEFAYIIDSVLQKQ